MPNAIITTIALSASSLLLVASVSSEGVPLSEGLPLNKNTKIEVAEPAIPIVGLVPSVVLSPTIPATLFLAGEVVPIKEFGIKDNLDKELIVNTYRHSATILYLKRAARWFPIIEPILAEEGIPDDFKYLAVIESGLSQAASPAGAKGFWQFLKKTGLDYGLEVSSSVDERYDVEKSTRAACRYLNNSYKKFGSWALSAAAYNMGSAGVSKRLKEQNATNYWSLYLNKETGRYLYRLLAIREILASPEVYGFQMEEKDLYSPYSVYKIEVTADIPNLSEFAIQNGSNLRELKVLNPWLRKGYLSVKSGKTYSISLPKTVTL